MREKIRRWLLPALSCVLLGMAGVAQAKQGGNAKQYAPGQQKKSATGLQGAQGAKQYAPGQQKKQAGQKNAKSYAPGQRKKNAGATNGGKGAKQFAPGQRRKNQAIQ